MNNNIIIKSFDDASNHYGTLYKGDCLQVMKTLPSNYFDLVLCDPPFGVTNCKWDSVIPLDDMWRELRRITKPNGAMVIFGSEPFTSVLICSNIKEFKYRWDWHKNQATGFLNAKKQPLRCIEDISVFYRKQCTYNPQKTTGHKPVNSYTKKSDGASLGKTTEGYTGGGQTDRYPKNVISIPVVKNDGSSKDGERVHTSQKPVDLMEYLLKTYSNPGDKVIDFAMGSGSTCIAAYNQEREFVGIELESSYFEIASSRIKDAINQDNLMEA